MPASELSSVLALVKDEGASITAEDLAATDALLTHMGVLLLDTLNDHGADVELSLPSLEQIFDRDERIQHASSNPYFVQIDAQDYLYDVLIAHHYLSSVRPSTRWVLLSRRLWHRWLSRVFRSWWLRLCWILRRWMLCRTRISCCIQF